jgi:hypothetical protein
LEELSAFKPGFTVGHEREKPVPAGTRRSWIRSCMSSDKERVWGWMTTQEVPWHKWVCLTRLTLESLRTGASFESPHCSVEGTDKYPLLDEIKCWHTGWNTHWISSRIDHSQPSKN